MPSLADHKVLGLAYAAGAGSFLLGGFLLVLLIRWQLAWPMQPLPGAIARLLGETNAPGGVLVPEFYYQLVAMHGTVMVFLGVVPFAVGAFGTYLVPLQIGAATLAFPRLAALAFWLYIAGGLAMFAGFALPGGAAGSGWTSYPPLSILATRGQDCWLVGMLLVGASSGLHALTMITTIVQLRSPAVPLFRMPFFVWAQLITALLLLLAFPALEAASLLQLMDRIAGTSFFLPTGLNAEGVTVAAVSGGGNVLLWQHLFWFLAHPEVYVLVLPALGIVAEVISTHARRSLYGYPVMVGAVLFLGVFSLLVWAHHMLLTGMSATLSSFFQITTMVVSLPSMVLITLLLTTLWGGAISFSLPMLFALAFLPMFGVGGLTGLPLGLAPSDVALHDTYYVVGHFHYLVAPGTLLALFAGVYHWFPAVTGRHLDRRLGLLHFWGSFVCLNLVFLPMFAMGLMGVNRRLYDAGLSYAHAQPAVGWNVWMTWSAYLLAAFQLLFLVNLVWSARRGTQATVNPWNATTLEWQQSSATAPGWAGPSRSAEVPQISFEHTAHPSSGLTNVQLGTWLLLILQTMLVASLVSAHLLLSAGPADSPAMLTGMPQALGWGAAVALASAWLVLSGPSSREPRALVRRTRLSSVGGLLYVLLAILAGAHVWSAGAHPSSHVLVGSWFVLTGVLIVYGAGGALATWRAGASALGDLPGGSPRLQGRIDAVRIYWGYLAVVWTAVQALFMWQ